ncbi:MAG: hypothetical protein ACLP4V_22335 [Methylocella sp.]
MIKLKLPVTFKRPKSQSLDARRQARQDLANRLQAAQDDLSGARHNAVQAALAAVPEGELVAAEDKIRRAEIHAATLENALLAMDVEIEEAEQAERVAADQAQRKATADDLEDRAQKLEKAAAPLAKTLADLKEALDGCVPIVGEIGMPGFIAELVKTLPDGFAVIVAEVRARAAATLTGSAPASLPRPFVPQIVEKKIEPTIQIFALEHLRWTPAAAGELSQADAFHIVALPVKYAEIALERRVACLPDDPRAEAIRANRHGPSAGAPRTVDLDRDPNAVAVYQHGRHVRDEPAQFVPFDRGPARTIFVDRPEPQPGPSDPNEGLFNEPA